MNFIIGQFLGIVGLMVSVAMVQFKNLKHVLIGSILSNLMVGLSYAFLNGMSGAWICIVAAVQALVIFLIIGVFCRYEDWWFQVLMSAGGNDF